MNKTSKKYEYISGLIQLFDTVEELKRDNDDLRRALIQQSNKSISEYSAKGNGDFAMFDYYAIKRGREKILNECIYSWKEVRARRGDDGEIKVTSFEDWLKEKVSHIPDYMSRKDFAKYFEVELTGIYEEEKAEAIEELKNSEKDEDDE